jgi:hypothetical protein
MVEPRIEMARRIARILGYAYVDAFDPDAATGKPAYFIPDDAMLTADAEALGIRGEQQLFGGVVPHEFVATKVVTHPLVAPDAAAPPGWVHGFAEDLAGSVLPGYSAFHPRDAREACARILPGGAARMKRACGIGGLGQSIVTSLAQLETLLAELPAGELETCGIVIEPHLEHVMTWSVGQVRLGDVHAAYCGVQRLTGNRNGDPVYGGSDLFFVRGMLEDLARRDLAERLELAVHQARNYDDAAHRAFSGFFASRRNYDVAQGRDPDGREWSGVLEQSWRIGGASPAEIAALEAFHADPDIDEVHASTHEFHALVDPPSGAMLQYRGIDETIGPITKYCTVGSDGSHA